MRQPLPRMGSRAADSDFSFRAHLDCFAAGGAFGVAEQWSRAGVAVSGWRGMELAQRRICSDGKPGTITRPAAASEQGAGTLGFAETMPKETLPAAGLTMLAGDEFGGDPRMPMRPGTWDRGPERGFEGGGDDGSPRDSE